ncbi:hypothetical protein [Actinomadura logoneensis]|nr:hypothetical protein [Actinomadura logoneensis]
MPGAFLEAAEAVGMLAAVTLAYRNLMKTRPNPPLVRKAAGHWFAASNKYKESLDSLQAAHYDLGIHWSGPAYMAFKGYMTGTVIEVAKNNSEAMKDAAHQLITLHNSLVDMYNEAMKEFMATVDKALDYYLKLNEAKGDMKKAVKSVLASFLSMWVRTVQNHVVLVRNLVDKGAAAMTELQGAIGAIRPPRGMGGAIKNKGQWSFTG